MTTDSELIALGERVRILTDAVRAIMARCEALEDEASNMHSDCSKVTSFYSGQKLTAKSIRRELHDLTRATMGGAA